MYQSSVAPHQSSRPRARRRTEAENRSSPATAQRPGGLPLPDGQLEALRHELEDQNWLTHLMTVMKAAGNDTRVRILYLLWRRGEVRVNDLASILELTTPAVSQQLKKLRSCNLVRARRDAQTIYYRLNPDSEFILSLIGFFEEGSH